MKRLFKGEAYRLTGYGIAGVGGRLRYNSKSFYFLRFFSAALVSAFLICSVLPVIL
ncbi:MAG: hypothetical protein LBJ00_07660 [Planctomycetaceae bacterium]|nr:hypothetical protein [Planctomycetaceae bacterium]